MRRYKLNWFWVFWAIALITMVFFYHRWHVAKRFIGIVETKSHLIGAQEPGTIRNTLVSIGENVKKGQVLVTLDISDLETEISQLKEELGNIEKLKGAQENQLSLEFQRTGLQLENEASDLAERLSLLEAKNTELAGLNAEIERLQKAEEAGLGHSRDLADLIRQRDVLASYLREQRQELQSQTQKLAKTRQSRQALEEADSDSIIKSMLLGPMEHAAELRRSIAIAEHRVQLRTVVAPCDGYVIEMFARPGDVVQEFSPILTIEESKPRFLTVYIPEQSNLQPKVGAHVRIYPSRLNRYTTTGVVSFVHPGFTQTSERLSFRGQIFWARKIHVDLDENHTLLPGEIVYARIENQKGDDNSLFTTARASETNSAEIDDPDGTLPILTDMRVSQTLWKQSRFEPSGIAWIRDIERFLIVSDDTGIQDSVNDHAPWLFLMDTEGKVDPTPVPLQGTNTVNDLEAVSSTDNGEIFLVSSQSISKRGKRPVSREMILKIIRDGKTFSVQGKVAFLSLLLDSYSREQLEALGLEQFADDGRPVLNIEGAAWHNGALYLGLKEPISKKGAIIWKLSNPNSMFSGQKLGAGQLSVYGYVQLGEYKDKTASISDLTFDHMGRLWALSTIAGAKNGAQMGGFHRIDRFVDGHLESTRIFSFTGLKPEGICLQNTERFLIVFDKDKETPSFCTVPVEGL